MVNTVLLENKISDSGLKKKYIAEKLGISTRTFAKKIKNESPIMGDEISLLCEILNISDNNQKTEIFLS